MLTASSLELDEARKDASFNSSHNAAISLRPISCMVSGTAGKMGMAHASGLMMVV